MSKTIEVEKLGWRVNEWAAAVGISRASVYELIAAKTIASVKFGGARLITTLPREFLASLRAAPAVARGPAQNVRKSAQKVLKRSALL